MIKAGLVLVALAVSSPAAAEGLRTLCTIVADDGGRVLLEEGSDCAERFTPASTFKVALAIMGFQSGFLRSGDDPVLRIRKGEPDWGGAEWKKPVGPAAWMRHSVVWYSQRIAGALGADTLTNQARAFAYGNADFSGDPGKNNGLQRAWIGSSLKISPREQIAFLAKLAAGRLPVDGKAARSAVDLLEREESGGWVIRGKTGSAFPRLADGSLDRKHGWGWYVGWAERDGRRLVFAHLGQDTGAGTARTGLQARNALLAGWAALASKVAAAQ